MPVINPQQGPAKNPKIEIRSAPLPTLWQRLREIKKKDLAFILAGLSVLVLAPVAQHMALKPGEDNSLEPGFATRESGSGGAGSESGSAPFEPGLGGFAPGQAPNGGQEAITPLASRDPSSLLMPPAGPPAPPKQSSADTVRDALNRALRASNSQNTVLKEPGLPRPTPRLASTLRGLAALAGAGATGAAPVVPGGAAGAASVLESAQSQPHKAEPRSYVGGIAPSDFKGAVRGNSGNAGSIEDLRSQAAKAAGHFDANSSAAGALTDAAKDSINPGPGGANTAGSGAGGMDTDKPHAGSNPPGGKFDIGTSLAYELAKMRAQKQLDLDFKKMEMQEMIPYEAEKKFAEMAMENLIGEGLMKPTGKLIGGLMSGKNPFAKAPSFYRCFRGHDMFSIRISEVENDDRSCMQTRKSDGQVTISGRLNKDGYCNGSVEIYDFCATEDADAGKKTAAADGSKDDKGVSGLGDTFGFNSMSEGDSNLAANMSDSSRSKPHVRKLSAAEADAHDAAAESNQAVGALNKLVAELKPARERALAAVAVLDALAGPKGDLEQYAAQAAKARQDYVSAGTPAQTLGADAQALAALDQESRKKYDDAVNDLALAVKVFEREKGGVNEVSESLRKSGARLDKDANEMKEAAGNLSKAAEAGDTSITGAGKTVGQFMSPRTDKIKQAQDQNADAQLTAKSWRSFVQDEPAPQMADLAAEASQLRGKIYGAHDVVRQTLGDAAARPDLDQQRQQDDKVRNKTGDHLQTNLNNSAKAVKRLQELTGRAGGSSVSGPTARSGPGAPEE